MITKTKVARGTITLNMLQSHPLTSQRHVTRPPVHFLLLSPLLLLLLVVFVPSEAVGTLTARRVDKTEEYSRYKNHPDTCEVIKPGSFCRDASVFYNTTALPNPYMAFTTQYDAELFLNQFAPLVSYGCNEKLRLFLCLYGMPWCTKDSQLQQRVVMPCRKTCESVKRSCLPVMLQFGFPWPRSLSCGRLPRKGELCVHFNGVTVD